MLNFLETVPWGFLLDSILPPKLAIKSKGSWPFIEAIELSKFSLISSVIFCSNIFINCSL